MSARVALCGVALVGALLLPSSSFAEPSPERGGGGENLSGLVTDEKGAPIASAEVEAFDAFVLLRRVARHEPLEDPRPFPATSRSTTDANGRFTIQGLRAGRYALAARAAGRGVGFLDGVPVGPGAPAVSLALAPGVVVEGNILDASGRPLPSVPVAVGPSFERERSWPESAFPRAFCSTDAGGHFRAEGVARVLLPQHGDFAIESYSVCAGNEALGLCHRFWISGLPAGPLVLRLGGTLKVRGTVTTAGHEPVPAALVVIRSMVEEPQGWSTYVATTKSGADGGYELRGLRPSEVKEVLAFAPTGTGLGRPDAQAAAELEGTSLQVEVSLLPSHAVLGKVTGPDGGPAADLEVFLVTPGGVAYSARTDAAGLYRVDGLPPVELSIVVAAAPFAQSPSPRSVPQGDDPEVREDVALVLPVPFSGRVLGADGKPLAGARVAFRRGEDGREIPCEDAVTGPDGAFLVPHVDPGDLTVTATHEKQEGYVEWRGRVASGSGAARVELRFPPPLPDPAAALARGEPAAVVEAQIGALVAVLRSEAPAAYRATAAGRLEALGPRASSAVPALMPLLRGEPDLWVPAARALAKIGEPAAGPLAERLAGDDAAWHLPAAQALVWMGVLPPAARRAAIQRLGSPDQGVRELCLEALAGAKPADPETVSALLGVLARHEARSTYRALDALGRLAPSDPRVAEALRPLLADAEQRKKAASTAKALGPAAAPLVPDLIAQIETSDDATYQDALGDALAAVGPAAVPALVAAVRREGAGPQARATLFRALAGTRGASLDALLALAKDEDASLRAKAIDSLAGVWPERVRVVATLQAALDDPDPEVRRAAVRRLGGLSVLAQAAVPAIAKGLDGGVADARVEAADALGEIGPAAKGAVPALLKALADPEADVRRRAAWALGRVGDPSAVPALAKVVEETDDADTSIGAALALARLGAGDGAAVPALVTLLGSPEPSVRREAAGVLAEFGPRAAAARERLEQAAAREEDASVRVAENVARAALDPAAALELLRPLLDVEDPFDFGRVATFLGRLGVSAAPLVPDLLRYAQDPKREDSSRAYRIAAIGAIGARTPAVEEALVALSKDPDPLAKHTRAEAFLALLSLGARVEESLPAVLAALDASPGVPYMERAARALGALGPKASPAVPALERLLDDYDAPVQRAALLALVQVSGR